MGEALLTAAGVVLHGGVVFDDAADDFEEADAARKGVGHGLEDEQAQRLVVVDLARGFTCVRIVRRGFDGRVADRHGGALDGRGRVLLDKVQQMIEGHVSQAAGEEHREDAVFAHGFMESGDEMLFGEGAGVEVLLHQLVLAFGDQLDQRLVAGLGVGSQAGGNLSGSLAAAVAAGGVLPGLHGDQVHHAVKSLRAGDGQLYRHAIAAPAIS